MINVIALEAGDRIELVGGIKATVVENMGDGQWIEARLDGEDSAELTHSEDIARILKD
jgi:preprotein translocase subunit YajC